MDLRPISATLMVALDVGCRELMTMPIVSKQYVRGVQGEVCSKLIKEAFSKEVPTSLCSTSNVIKAIHLLSARTI